MSAKSCAWTETSNADVGSSAMISSGFKIKALAIATLWF